MTRKRWILLVSAVLVGALLLAPKLFSRPLPAGEAGPAADELARRVMAATGYEGWQRTGAVAFSFRGKHHHLWDRERGFLRLTVGDEVVWLDLATRRGIAEKAGKPVAAKALPEKLEKAWSFFCNDTFWLNPLAKLFDDGTTRLVAAPPAEHPGQEALLISYASGGVTPGDSYLWILGADGKPTHWRMWTSILPIKGLEASWEGWRTLPTGAEIATRHEIGPTTLEIGELRGAAHLAELEPGDDPFAALVSLLAKS